MGTTVTLAGLLTVLTEDQCTADQLAVLQAGGFQTTWWGDTAPEKIMVKANSRSLAKLSNCIPLIAAGGYVTLAGGDFLTLLAASNYQQNRTLATLTQRVVRITDAGAAPRTFNPGDIVLSTSTGLLFTSIGTLGNVGGQATLGIGSFVDVLIQAQTPGSAYNGAAGTWTLVTSIPGITVADAPAGVTLPGIDQQSDPSLQTACINKWATLGTGANDAAYQYNSTNAPKAVGLVTRVIVQRHTPNPGQVTITIAGPTGSSPADGAVAVSNTDVNSAVTQTGTGPTVTLAGVPLGDYTATIKITTGGALGVGAFTYSLDNGVTFNGPITIPGGGTYVIPSTGITVTFASGTYVLGTTYAWLSTLSVVTHVQNYIDPPGHVGGKAPTCVDGFVVSATYKKIALVGTINGVALELAAAQTAALARLNSYASAAAINGTVPLSRILEMIEHQFSDDPRNVVSLTSPSADVVLSGGQVPYFDVSGLVWNAV